MSDSSVLSEVPKKVMNRLRNLLHKRNVKRAHSRHRRRHVDEYRKYDRIVHTFRSSGGLKHDFQAYKLYQLSNLLKQEKPKSILELGSGTSTVIFLDYIREEGGACLTSVDESRYWLDNTKKLAGICEDEKAIELIYAARIHNIQVQPKETRYDYRFDRSFDFVLIDGPTLMVDGIRDKSTVNTDIFDIAKHELPSVIAVDMRKATVEAIMKRAGNYYDIYLSDLITKKIRDNYRYFSIFKLKENCRAFPCHI
jgi:SAM-dependent methyltransferase